MATHYCNKHKTVWFKKGNMKGFAHPIKDGDGNTTGWCNEPEVVESPGTKPPIEKPSKPEAEMSKADWAEKEKQIPNPYEAKLQSLEASLPGKLNLTLADLFRAQARAWQQGLEAGQKGISLAPDLTLTTMKL